ncbi:MAG: RtcB family protein, partial [Hyphomicrobiaceae bacterium]
MNRDFELLAERSEAARAAGNHARPVKMWTRGVPVEEQAQKQLLNTASMPFIFKHLAVMPDVHYGIGSTVGSVIPTKGAIIPAAVGVDIGCGMMAWQLTLSANDLPDNLQAIRSDIERAVPHGFVTMQGRSLKGGWAVAPASVSSRWRKLEGRYGAILEKHPKIAHKRPMEQLGSLGTGNHFIELCLDE